MSGTILEAFKTDYLWTRVWLGENLFSCRLHRGRFSPLCAHLLTFIQHSPYFYSTFIVGLFRRLTYLLSFNTFASCATSSQHQPVMFFLQAALFSLSLKDLTAISGSVFHNLCALFLSATCGALPHRRSRARWRRLSLVGRHLSAEVAPSLWRNGVPAKIVTRLAKPWSFATLESFVLHLSDILYHSGERHCSENECKKKKKPQWGQV